MTKKYIHVNQHKIRANKKMVLTSLLLPLKKEEQILIAMR